MNNTLLSVEEELTKEKLSANFTIQAFSSIKRFGLDELKHKLATWLD
jgi:GTP-binding protein EngB required for normal cell division